MEQLEQLLYNFAVDAAGIKLFCTARYEDEAREFYPKITSSEIQNIHPYLLFKGMKNERISELQSIISKASQEDLKDLERWSDQTLLLFKHYLALKPYTFEMIAKDLEDSYNNNRILDPEEFKINEVKLKLEELITPKNLDLLYKLIEPYNQDKKIMLIMQGQPKAIDIYVEALKKSKIETATLSLKDWKRWKPEDRNHMGRLNGIVVAFDSFPLEHREQIKQTFRNLDTLGYNLPRLAILTNPKDKPQDFNVHAVLHGGATMEAFIENILRLYKNYYLGKVKNGNGAK